jgi:hypothetical protein
MEWDSFIRVLDAQQYRLHRHTMSESIASPTSRDQFQSGQLCDCFDERILGTHWYMVV